MQGLDILNYGVSMTTLEEVFHKVNAEERDNNSKNEADKQLDTFLNKVPNEHFGSSINRKEKNVE